MRLSHLLVTLLPAMVSAVSEGPCTGRAASLAQPQCDAWRDFYDATQGPSWSYCTTPSIRSDPCSCGYIICLPATPFKNETQNIIGFRLGPTNLNGTLPASMKAFTELDFFKIEGNHLHGPLPDIDYSRFSDPGTCSLYDHKFPGGSNAFDCPWPAHVVENCGVKVDGCVDTAKYTCMKGQCVEHPTGVSKTDCSAICTPPHSDKYVCTDGQCIASSRGVSKAQCESACGPAAALHTRGATALPVEIVREQ